MTAPATLLTARWLLWDTLRQAVAARLPWLLLAVTVVAVVFCLGTDVSGLPRASADDLPSERLPSAEARKVAPGELAKSGVDVIDGRVTFLFGAVSVPWNTYREDAVRFLQLVLAGGVADTFGLLFVLIWTAALLPDFLEPASATVLLAKPVPRWSLLGGKYAGVVGLVAMQSALFVVATWLAIGARSGVWAPGYLLSVPLLTVHFMVFFSVSALLAVWARSATACMFGVVLFWLACWSVNVARHADNPSWLVEAGYWILPRPADGSQLLAQSIGAIGPVPNANPTPEGWLLGSMVFVGGMLALAGWRLMRAVY